MTSMVRLIEDKGIIDVDDDDGNGEDDDDHDDSDQDRGYNGYTENHDNTKYGDHITDDFLEDNDDDDECIETGQKLCREIKEVRIFNVTLCLIIVSYQILKFNAHRCGHANNTPLVER